MRNIHFLLILALISLFGKCDKSSGPSVPVLTTTPASSITAMSAVSGGNISSDGGSAVTARGICWSTSPGPTISLTTKTSDGTGTGIFSSNMGILNANTTYYVRAYATNSLGTGYGNEISFTAATIDLTTDLVGFWPFSGNANDQSGNGYNGSVTGASLTADRFGVANSAYSFNGSTQDGSNNTIVTLDNGIDVNGFNVNFGSKLSLSFWANVAAGNTNSFNFLHRRSNNNIDFACNGDNNTSNYFLGTVGIVGGSINIPNQTWHHYACTYDGTNIKIYVDGVLDKQVSGSGSIANNSSFLGFGKYVYDNGVPQYYFYKGKLDDIRIYKRALTTDQVTYLATH